MAEDDHALAHRVAEGAGALLLALRGGEVRAGEALDAAEDRTSNAFIMAALRAHRPDDAVLSKEEVDPARLERDRVCIVDPLDGTREHGEGRDDWTVHVGLAVDGVAVDRVRTVPDTGKAGGSGPAAGLGAALLPMGSAGAKAVAVARAAGPHTSRLDGSALRCNRSNALLPDLLVCRPEHAERVLHVLAEDKRT